MTVTVRPGKPNAAASSFMSGIIREPLAGLRAACPVRPDTPVALSSPRRTLEGILRAAAVSDAAWGSTTAMNLPALDHHAPGDGGSAMDRVAGYAASDLIDWTDDPVTGPIVRSWPASVEAPRAPRSGCARRRRSTTSCASTSAAPSPASPPLRRAGRRWCWWRPGRQR